MQLEILQDLVTEQTMLTENIFGQIYHMLYDVIKAAMERKGACEKRLLIKALESAQADCIVLPFIEQYAYIGPYLIV